MKSRYLQILVLLLLYLPVSLSAQTKVNPVIKNYGTIYDIPDAQKPDPNIEYNLVIDFKSSNEDSENINKGLNNLARMLNLYAAGGVPNDHVHIVVAIHNVATPVVLNNVGYQEKYGINNPNTEIIHQLKSAGVKFYVCGQSMLSRGYPFAHLNPDINLALSMLTISTEYMMKGYSLLVFN